MRGLNKYKHNSLVGTTSHVSFRKNIPNSWQIAKRPRDYTQKILASHSDYVYVGTPCDLCKPKICHPHTQELHPLALPQWPSFLTLLSPQPVPIIFVAAFQRFTNMCLCFRIDSAFGHLFPHTTFLPGFHRSWYSSFIWKANRVSKVPAPVMLVSPDCCY